MIVDFEIKIFPIYGLMLGVNYWDSEMDENETTDETQKCLQFMFLFMGISLIWYKNK